MTAVPKRSYFFVVRIPAVEDLTKRDAKAYVRDAVRSFAGGSHPDDPLFGVSHKIVVKDTLYEMERETLMNLKKDVRRYFEGNELPSGIYHDVMKIIDSYITRS